MKKSNLQIILKIFLIYIHIYITFGIGLEFQNVVIGGFKKSPTPSLTKGSRSYKLIKNNSFTT